MECLVTKLLSRGDTVSIELGRLTIQPASGKPVPAEWLIESTPDICRTILKASGLNAFEYVGYKTGHYGKHKAPGLTLRFASVVTGETAHAIFNVDMTRQRTTLAGKAGEPLPTGQFRVGERSHFYKFWLGTGLQMPDRLQRFHKCMGKLSGILFDGTLNNDRFDAHTIRPVSLTAEQVRMTVLGHKEGTTKAQLRHKEGTRSGHKETAPDHTTIGFQQIQSACAANHENKLIRKHDNKMSPITPIPAPKAPQDQSVDEWLADYGSDPMDNESSHMQSVIAATN